MFQLLVDDDHQLINGEQEHATRAAILNRFERIKIRPYLERIDQEDA